MLRETRAHTKPRYPRLPALATLIAALTSGCLGPLYEVPRSELQRLVQTPPEQRGQGIHAVQQFSTTDEPEPAPPWAPPVGVPPPDYSYSVYGHWVPSVYVRHGAPTYSPPPPPIGVHDATPIGAPGSSHGGSSSSGSSSSVSGGKASAELLAVAVVIGVAVGIGLAATEGARFEGTVAVHPHHPVHLWRRDGAQAIVGLDELTPEYVADTERAVLVGHEGAGMWLLDRAPLNRKGFTFQFGAGNDSLPLTGWQTWRSPGFRFALGYFPTRRFGLLTDWRIQAGTGGQDTFYNSRLGLEAQWSPLVLWRLHLGGFVGGGQAWSGFSGNNSQQPYVTFGGLAEIDLTTRLGLTFRWTQEWRPAASVDRSLSNAWSVGLAIY